MQAEEQQLQNEVMMIGLHYNNGIKCFSQKAKTNFFRKKTMCFLQFEDFFSEKRKSQIAA